MDIRRRIGLVLATAVLGSGAVLVGAPAAWADAGTAVRAAVPAVSEVARPCRPEHQGPRWRWHATGRTGHWDYLVWRRDGRDHRWERQWVHLRQDDRYCMRRADGPPRRDER